VTSGFPGHARPRQRLSGEAVVQHPRDQRDPVQVQAAARQWLAVRQHHVGVHVATPVHLQPGQVVQQGVDPAQGYLRPLRLHPAMERAQ
jgi:hypothetical protein